MVNIKHRFKRCFKKRANQRAARGRIRIARGNAEPPDEPPFSPVKLPRLKAKWRMVLTDLENGDSKSASFLPTVWRGKYVSATGDSVKTTLANFARIIKNAA